VTEEFNFVDLVWHEQDVDVSWWVTPAAYQRGYYDKVYAALQNWIAGEFPFSRPYYSNIAIPSA
jgi:hypothetical protein